MQTLSWRAAREQLLSELQSEADGRTTVPKAGTDAPGEALGTSQPGASGQISPSKATRRPTRNSASGHNTDLPDNNPEAAAPAAGFPSALSSGRPGSSGAGGGGVRVQELPRQGFRRSGSDMLGTGSSLQQAPPAGDPRPAGPSGREPQLPYRANPRGSGAGVADTRLVTGDVHIVSTRPRPARASLVMESSAAPAAGSPPVPRGPGAVPADQLLNTTNSELPILPQTQHALHYRGSGTGIVAVGGGGVAQARQKRVSQSNNLAAATTGDGVVRLPPSPARVTLSGAAGRPAAAAAVAAVAAVPAGDDPLAGSMPPLPRAIRSSTGALDVGVVLPSGGGRAAVESSPRQQRRRRPTSPLLPLQQADAVTSAAVAPAVAVPGTQVTPAASVAAVPRGLPPKPRLDAAVTHPHSQAAAVGRSSISGSPYLQYPGPPVAQSRASTNGMAVAVGVTHAAAASGNLMPLTAEALALHTTYLHGTEVWEETAAAVVAADAAKAAVEGSPTIGPSAASSPDGASATAMAVKNHSPPQVPQRASSIPRNAEATDVGRPRQEVASVYQQQQQQQQQQQSSALSGGLTGSREYIQQRVCRISDAAGAVLVLGRPPSATSVVGGGSGGMGSWTVPHPIGSVRTSETGDGVKIVANRRASATLRRASQMSDGGGIAQNHGMATQASVTMSAGPSFGIVDMSGGSAPPLHWQLQQLRQQYGHMYPPSPPRQGTSSVEAAPPPPPPLAPAQPSQSNLGPAAIQEPPTIALEASDSRPLNASAVDRQLPGPPPLAALPPPSQTPELTHQPTDITSENRWQEQEAKPPPQFQPTPAASSQQQQQQQQQQPQSSSSQPRQTEQQHSMVGLQGGSTQRSDVFSSAPMELLRSANTAHHVSSSSSLDSLLFVDEHQASHGVLATEATASSLQPHQQLQQPMVDSGKRASDAVLTIAEPSADVGRLLAAWPTMTTWETFSAVGGGADGGDAGDADKAAEAALAHLSMDMGVVALTSSDAMASPPSPQPQMATPAERDVIGGPNSTLAAANGATTEGAVAPASVQDGSPLLSSVTRKVSKDRVAAEVTCDDGIDVPVVLRLPEEPQPAVEVASAVATELPRPPQLGVGELGNRSTGREAAIAADARNRGSDVGDNVEAQVAQGGWAGSPMMRSPVVSFESDLLEPEAAAAVVVTEGGILRPESREVSPSGRTGQGSGLRVFMPPQQSSTTAAVLAGTPADAASLTLATRAAPRRAKFAADVRPSGDGGDAITGVGEDVFGHPRHEYVPKKSMLTAARTDLGDIEGGGGIGRVEEDDARRRAAQRRASSARSNASRPISAASRRHGNNGGGGGGRRRHATQGGMVGPPAIVDVDADPDGFLSRGGVGRTMSSTSRAGGGRASRIADNGFGGVSGGTTGGGSATGGGTGNNVGGNNSGTVAQLAHAAAVVGSSQGGRKVVMDVMVVRAPVRRAYYGERRSDSILDGVIGSDGGSVDSDLEQLRRGLHSRTGSVLAGAAARSRPTTARSRPTTANPNRSSSRPTTAHQRPTTASSRRSIQDDTNATDAPFQPRHHRHQQQQQSDSLRPASAARSVRSSRGSLAGRPTSARATKSRRRGASYDQDSDDGSTMSDISDVSEFTEGTSLAQGRSAARLRSHRNPARSRLKSDFIVGDSRIVSRTTLSSTSFDRGATTSSIGGNRSRRSIGSIRQGSDTTTNLSGGGIGGGASNDSPDDDKASILAKLAATGDLKVVPATEQSPLPRGPTMAMVREAHVQLQQQKAAFAKGGEVGLEDLDSSGEAPLRRQDAGADSYMLRIFGSAYTKVAGGADYGDTGAFKVWLHPYSTVRMRFDMVWVAAALLMAVIMPLQIAFTTRSTAVPYLLTCLAGSAAWMAHVVCNFLTGYDEDGMVVMDAVKVRNRYFRRFLLLDVIGALPYALIPVFICGSVSTGVPGGGGNCSIHSALLLRLWALLQLATLPRLIHYLSKWQDTWDIDIHMMRLVKLLGTAMIFTHLFACISFYVQLIEGFPLDGWVEVLGLDDRNAWITYNFALLRALQVVMGSNVDVVSTNSSVEVVFTICSYIVGVVFYTILVGIMSSIVLSLNRTGQMYVEKLQIWRDYCHYRRLPGELRSRVMSYINTAHSNKRVLDDTTMLLELSPGLRTDINLQLCAELVATVPVFLECSPIVVRAIVSKLQRETHVTGDFVFRVGDIADAVYFILKGTVSISDETGAILTKLAQGSHFGEFGILAYLDGQLGVRTAAARADDCVELYKLHCEDFAALADYYPELVDFFRDVAVVRSAYNATLRANRALTEMSGSGSESGSGYDGEYDDEYDDQCGNEQDRGVDSSQLFTSSSGEEEEYEDLMRGDMGGGSELIAAVTANSSAAAATAVGSSHSGSESLASVAANRHRLRLAAGSAAIKSRTRFGESGGGTGGSGDGVDDNSTGDGSVAIFLPPGLVPDEYDGTASSELRGVRMFDHDGGGPGAASSRFHRPPVKAVGAAVVVAGGDVDFVSPSGNSFGTASNCTTRQARSVKFAISNDSRARPTQPLLLGGPQDIGATDAGDNCGGLDPTMTGPGMMFMARAAPHESSPFESATAVADAASSREFAESAVLIAPVSDGTSIVSSRSIATLSPDLPVGCSATDADTDANVLLSIRHGGTGTSHNFRNRVVPQDSLASHISAVSEVGIDTTDNVSAEVMDADATEQGLLLSPSTRTSASVTGSTSAFAALNGALSLSRGKVRHAPVVTGVTASSGSGSGANIAAVAGLGGGAPTPGRGTSRLRNISIIAPEDNLSDAASCNGSTNASTDLTPFKVSPSAAAAAATAELVSSVPMLARMRKVTDVVSFLNAVSRSGTSNSNGGGGNGSHSIKARPGTDGLGPPPQAALATGLVGAGVVPPVLARVGSIAGGGSGGVHGALLTRVGSIVGGNASAFAATGISHGASRGNLLAELAASSGGGGDDSPSLSAVHPQAYNNFHSQSYTQSRHGSGDLSQGSGGGISANAPVSLSRGISSSVSGLLHKLLHTRSNKDASSASSREAAELSLGYEDDGSGGGGGGGTVNGRPDHHHQLLHQAIQPLRRRSVTMGHARNNASFIHLPGSTSLRNSHLSGMMADLDNGAVATTPLGGGGGGGTTSQVSVAAMRLASISAGTGLAARLASVSTGALSIGGAGATAVAGSGGTGLPPHLHHHHHLHPHHSHHTRASGSGANITRDLLATGTVYHGQHPLGPGVMNLGFG